MRILLFKHLYDFRKFLILCLRIFQHGRSLHLIDTHLQKQWRTADTQTAAGRQTTYKLGKDKRHAPTHLGMRAHPHPRIHTHTFTRSRTTHLHLCSRSYPFPPTYQHPTPTPHSRTYSLTSTHPYARTHALPSHLSSHASPHPFACPIPALSPSRPPLPSTHSHRHSKHGNVKLPFRSHQPTAGPPSQSPASAWANYTCKSNGL